MPQGGVESQGLVAGVCAFGWVLGWFRFGLQASIVTVNQLSVKIIGLLCYIGIYFTLTYGEIFQYMNILFSNLMNQDKIDAGYGLNLDTT